MLVTLCKNVIGLALKLMKWQTSKTVTFFLECPVYRYKQFLRSVPAAEKGLILTLDALTPIEETFHAFNAEMFQIVTICDNQNGCGTTNVNNSVPTGQPHILNRSNLSFSLKCHCLSKKGISPF